MKNFIYRLKSYFPSMEGKIKLQALSDYLSHSPIKFEVEKINEDGKKYFLAIGNLEKGEIITTGETIEELNKNIKDAIFTAFDVPAFYCNFDLIKEQSEVSQLEYATV